MQLTILGSGTAVPDGERTAPAAWLESGHGSVILDCGSTTPYRAARENLDWVNLNAIWISHFHLDHTGGLSPFLFGTRHAPQNRARRHPLVIAGPVGLKKLLDVFNQTANGKLFRQPFPVEIREVAPDTEFELLPGLSAQTFSTPHTPESLAIRLTNSAGKVMVHTSDTGYSDALSGFAMNADLLLMECSFFKNKPVKTHLELAEAARISEQAKVGRVVLNHLYPEWTGTDLEFEASKLWNGKTIEARDGLKIEI